MIKLIGYWTHNGSSEEGYPDPCKMQDPKFWETRDKAGVIKYLKNGRHCNQYLGYSGCRICDQMLGTHERTDGVWCWPDKLEHYIEVHDVVLPEEFIKHTTELFPIHFEITTGSTQPLEDFHPDETFWVEWSKKYRDETYDELKARFKTLAKAIE